MVDWKVVKPLMAGQPLWSMAAPALGQTLTVAVVVVVVVVVDRGRVVVAVMVSVVEIVVLSVMVDAGIVLVVVIVSVFETVMLSVTVDAGRVVVSVIVSVFEIVMSLVMVDIGRVIVSVIVSVFETVMLLVTVDTGRVIVSVTVLELVKVAEEVIVMVGAIGQVVVVHRGQVVKQVDFEVTVGEIGLEDVLLCVLLDLGVHAYGVVVAFVVVDEELVFDVMGLEDVVVYDEESVADVELFVVVVDCSLLDDVEKVVGLPGDKGLLVVVGVVVVGVGVGICVVVVVAELEVVRLVEVVGPADVVELVELVVPIDVVELVASAELVDVTGHPSRYEQIELIFDGEAMQDGSGIGSHVVLVCCLSRYTSQIGMAITRIFSASIAQLSGMLVFIVRVRHISDRKQEGVPWLRNSVPRQQERCQKVSSTEIHVEQGHGRIGRCMQLRQRRWE